MSFHNSFSSFTYRLNDGTFPRYHGAIIGNAIWMTVGKLRLMDVPWGMLLHRQPKDDPTRGIIDATSISDDPVFLAKLPAFLERKSWWRCFQPTYQEIGTQWYQVGKTDDIIDETDAEPDGTFQFPHWLIEEMRRDCLMLRDDIEALRKLSLFPPHAPVPSCPSFEALDQAYYSLKDFGFAYVKYLVYYWGGQGLFKWWRLYSELYCPLSKWWHHLPSLTVERVKDWKLEMYASRGVLLNMARDRHRIDLNLLIHSEIGFAYPWTRIMQEDIRYLRWSPVYLARLVKFSNECEDESSPLRERLLATQLAGDLRSVTSFDSALSRVEIVSYPGESEIPLNTVRVNNGVTNSYFALVSGWDPLPVTSNSEWNMLAKHFQVTLCSRADVEGPVYIAWAQRPYGNLIQPPGEARKLFSRTICPWEFLSTYWTVELYIRWYYFGLFHPTISIYAPPQLRHEASLAALPYYFAPEFDSLLFLHLIPPSHEWRLKELRSGQIENMMASAGHGDSFTGPTVNSQSDSSSWIHNSAAPRNKDPVQNEKKKMIRVYLGKEYGRVNGEVKDTAANRMLWRAMGNVRRTLPIINNADLIVDPLTSIEPNSSEWAGFDQASAATASEVVSDLQPRRIADNETSVKFESFGNNYYSTLHRWKLPEKQRPLKTILVRNTVMVTSTAGEIALKIWTSRSTTVPNADELVTAMIEHGMPLQLGCTRSDLALVRRSPPPSCVEESDINLFLRKQKIDPNHAYVHHQGADCAKEYLARLEELKVLDSASSLLGVGGVMNFIVRSHMPNLADLYFEGISTETGMWRSDPWNEAGDRIWINEPSPDLIKLVAGFRDRNDGSEGASIYPLPNWIRPDPQNDKRSDGKKGLPFWAPGHWESQFFNSMQSIADSIKKNEVRTRTRTQWRQFFRNGKGCKTPWFSIMEEAGNLCAKSYGGRWNWKPIHEVANDLRRN